MAIPIIVITPVLTAITTSAFPKSSSLVFLFPGVESISVNPKSFDTSASSAVLFVTPMFSLV